MMRLLFVLFATVAASPLLAQVQLYLPIDQFGPGYGACKITAVSSATPARITVENITVCGIQATDGPDPDTDPDNRIRIQGARSSLSATSSVMNINTHPLNSTDWASGLCHLATNIVGNSFDLRRCDNTAVTASTTWVTGGLVYRVTLQTIRPDLAMIPDAVISGLSNTGSGGWANPSSLPMQVLTSLTDTYAASSPGNGSDPAFKNTTLAALRWLTQGRPGSSTFKDAAKIGVQNFRQYWGTTACDETASGGSSGCGQPDSEITDYRIEIYGLAAMLGIEIMYPTLATGEQQDLRDWLLNDLPQNQGGHNFPGTSLTKPTWKPSPGTITFSGTSVTGAGFLTNGYVAGDYILYPYNVYSEHRRIVSVNSDNSLTVDRPSSSGSGTYRVGPGWAPGQMGVMWAAKHMGFAMLCGSDYFNPSSVSYGCPDYPPGGGLYPIGTGNHNLGRIAMDIAVGLVMAKAGDIRGAWLLADAAGFFFHVQYPALLTEHTGITPASSAGYAQSRNNVWPVMSLGLLRTGFVGAPNYAHAEFLDSNAAWTLASIIPGSGGVPLPTQNDAFPGDRNSLQGIFATFPYTLYFPERTYVPAALAANPFDPSWTTGNFNRQGQYTALGFLGHRPDVTPVGLTNPTFLFRSLRAYCDAQSAYFCAPPPSSPDRVSRTAIVSRIGTPSAQSKTMFWNVVGHHQTDQFTQKPETGLQVYVAGKAIYAPDGPGGSRYGNSGENFGNITFPGRVLKNFYTDIATTLMTRSAGNQYFAAGSADVSGHYVTSPGGSVWRHFVHAKRGGSGTNDVMLELYQFPTNGTALYHLYIADGCGTPTASSCVSLNQAAGTWIHTQTGARGLGKMVLGDGVVATANASNTDGSYPGGNGNTFRIGVTGQNFGVLTRPTTNTSETLAPTVAISSGAWSGVEWRGASPAVMVVAQANQSFLPAISVTSNNYQLVALGLNPGTYAVKVNDVNVSGCGSISVVSGEHALECGSVPNGTLTAVQIGGPLTIDTTSLAGGTIGISYSQSLSASGGTSPYTWGITSGTLPPGLSIVGSAITGTPTTAGTYPITLGVTDSASGSTTRPLSIVIGAGAPIPIGNGFRGGITRGTIK